jgi:hypothetical protein
MISAARDNGSRPPTISLRCTAINNDLITMKSLYNGTAKSCNKYEDFLAHTAARRMATVEAIDKIIHFGSKAAKKSFGRDVIALDYEFVKSINHSAESCAKSSDFSMSFGILIDIRKELEAAEYLKIITAGRRGAVTFAKGQPRSPITKLIDVDYEGLALLARVLLCSLVEEMGWEKVQRDHNWGGLAANVRTLTGFSLFSMDDEVEDVGTEARKLKKEIDFGRYWQELTNAKGIKGYYEDVKATMIRKFGADWASDLPF